MLYPITNKFIIFGHARSGTSTLKELINTQKIKILGEPFNKDVNLDYFLKTNSNNFKQVLKDIFLNYDGIKHLFHQLNININSKIVKQYPVIFLRRKNFLQAALSSIVSIKTGIWAKNDVKQDLHKLYEKIGKIDIDAIKHSMNEFKTQGNYYESILKKSYKIYYEELYSNNSKNIICEIFNFINHEIVDWNAIMELMNKSNKLNNLETYNNIINIKDIKKLESKENGYL